LAVVKITASDKTVVTNVQKDFWCPMIKALRSNLFLLIVSTVSSSTELLGTVRARQTLTGAQDRASAARRLDDINGFYIGDGFCSIFRSAAANPGLRRRVRLLSQGGVPVSDFRLAAELLKNPAALAATLVAQTAHQTARVTMSTTPTARKAA
jgi:hypothetical protein